MIVSGMLLEYAKTQHGGDRGSNIVCKCLEGLCKEHPSRAEGCETLKCTLATQRRKGEARVMSNGHLASGMSRSIVGWLAPVWASAVSVEYN